MRPNSWQYRCGKCGYLRDASPPWPFPLWLPFPFNKYYIWDRCPNCQRIRCHFWERKPKPTSQVGKVDFTFHWRGHWRGGAREGRTMASNFCVIQIALFALVFMLSLSACSPRVDWVPGKSSVRVTKVTFTGQQRRAECTSAEIIEYFNKCLARPRTVFDEGGHPYTCLVVGADGSEYKVIADVGLRGTLGFRTSTAEERVFGMERVAPVPASYAALMEFLSNGALAPDASKTF